MIELNEEQQARSREAMQATGPVEVVDPATGETFVLVRKDAYEKMRKVIDGMTRRAGWDDPALDIYEVYREGTTK